MTFLKTNRGNFCKTKINSFFGEEKWNVKNLENYLEMGITGLLPFLDKASRRVHVSEFKGSKVAIDVYCKTRFIKKCF